MNPTTNGNYWIYNPTPLKENPESLGQLVEYYLCKVYNLKNCINKLSIRKNFPINYLNNIYPGLEHYIRTVIKPILDSKGMDIKKWSASGGSPVDFILENNETLSVKSNQNIKCKNKFDRSLSAPQKIGQPTVRSIYPNFEKYAGIDMSSYKRFKNGK